MNCKPIAEKIKRHILYSGSSPAFERYVDTLGTHALTVLAGYKDEIVSHVAQKALARLASPKPAQSTCCIQDYCGMPFDPTIPETRDPLELKAFWQRYCPKHRVNPNGRRVAIVNQPAKMTLDIMTAKDLNLDSESIQDLWEFWKRTNSVRPIAFAKQLFPNREKGYVRATKNLGHYASNKATAMQCRLDGKTDTAIMYEKICDRIYNELPDWAKGW